MKNSEIRFIDDNIDWETKQLKEVSVPLKSETLTQDKLSPDGKYPVVNGGVSYYGYYDNYNNENAFTISARGENAGFCRFNKDKFWAGGLCYPYKGKGLFDTHFISILLNKYEKAIKENYVIRTSIPAVNKSDIEHFNMKFPSISVQKEISSLLSDIDQKISNQEILIQKLKDTKSALLIKMFPQKNQSIPELRFDGFTNDWEQRKVGEYYDFKNGLNKGKDFFGFGTPIVNFTDVFHNRALTFKNLNGRVFLENSEIRNYQVKQGDIFFTRTSETIEEIGYPSVMLDEPYNTVFSGFVLRGRCFLKIDPLDNLFKKYVFFTNAFRKEMVQKSSMTTRALTSGTAIKNMEFYHPISKEEQEKIGRLISTLDNLITLHQRKSFHLNFFL